MSLTLKWWWQPSYTPRYLVCRSAIPPLELHATISHNWAFQHLLTVLLHVHAQVCTHTLPLLASVQSLCPVWERLRKTIKKSWFISQYSIRYGYPELNSDWNTLPCLFFPPQNKSLHRCISHRSILAFFEVSGLTWKYGCFGLLYKGLAVYIISNMQSVKALMGTAGWGEPKQESVRVEAKQIKHPQPLLLGCPNKQKKPLTHEL